MKKVILAVILSLTLSLSAQAASQVTAQVATKATEGFSFNPFSFDLGKLLEPALVAGEHVVKALEELRLAQHQVLDIRQQWDIACEFTTSVNPSILALNKTLIDLKVNKITCTPITTVIKLNSDILGRCKDYYSKPVPENVEFLLGKFAISAFQTRMLLHKCYPALKNVKIPGLP